jgi:hypothetical protein
MLVIIPSAVELAPLTNANLLMVDSPNLDDFAPQANREEPLVITYDSKIEAIHFDRFADNTIL